VSKPKKISHFFLDRQGKIINFDVPKVKKVSLLISHYGGSGGYMFFEMMK
jgi:hypothetical protein